MSAPSGRLRRSARSVVLRTAAPPDHIATRTGARPVAGRCRQRGGAGPMAGAAPSGAALDLGDLVDPTPVATALERRVEPQRDDLVGQPGGDDAPADGQHVGVVVLA